MKNTPISQLLGMTHDEYRVVSLVALCGLLVAAPWFWPLLRLPISATWPNLFAWAIGAVLITLLPLTGARSGLALAGGWLFAAILNSILGLLQFFDVENALYPWVVHTSPGYVVGNVHQVNMLTTLLSVGLLSLWWMRENRYVPVTSAAGMACLLLMTLAATASRTGLVHLIAISGVLLLWNTDRRRHCLLVLIAGWATFAIFSFLLPWLVWLVQGISIDRQLLNRFGMELACHSRRVLWGNVIDLIALRPWMGWGSGELLFAHYITQFDGIRFCEKASHAHNIVLQMAVTMGLPITAGLVGVLCFFLLWLKPWAVKSSTERLCWGVVMLIGLHSMLEYPLWFAVFQTMLLMAVWQIYIIRRGESLQYNLLVVGRAVISAIGMAMIILLAWEYHKVSQLFIPPSERMEQYRDDTYAKVYNVTFFRNRILIAQVVGTPLERGNAQAMLDASLALLHVQPDPPIIQRVIDSAQLLGFVDLAEFHKARFRAAWPKAYEKWKSESQLASESGLTLR